MNKYYYLIAGLPELSLEDSKLNYTVSNFKSELYPNLSETDKRLIDLFYLKFDNQNVLRLLADKETKIDERGNYAADELCNIIEEIKDGTEIPEKQFPPYLSQFIALQLSEEKIDAYLAENTLTSAYYNYAMQCSNKVIASWFDFNLSVNNIIVALMARKYKQDVSQNIIGETYVSEALRTSHARDFGIAGDVPYLEQLIKMVENDDLLEREKRIDRLKWEWMDDAIFFNYFTIERIFMFLVKLEMIERWLELDKETGNKMFREIIETLRNEVEIPTEKR